MSPRYVAKYFSLKIAISWGKWNQQPFKMHIQTLLKTCSWKQWISLGKFELLTPIFVHILHIWSWLGPSVTTVQYVVYFRLFNTMKPMDKIRQIVMFRRVHQMATPGAKLLCKTADALLLSKCALVTYTVYYLKMGHA